jgi:UDPglucose 6-dehydrogenase
MATIAVIGAGYVGLVTGTCFAQKGNRVIVIERDQEKILMLLQGKIPFYEPGLDALVLDAINKNLLTFESSIQAGLTHNPSIIFSCVGTPSLPNGAADLSYIHDAANEIGRSINKYVLIVNKSTVPVGTAKTVKTLIKSQLAAREITFDIDVASNPEFLKEGDAINDFLSPDRVVVGVDTERAYQLLYDLYRPFLKDDSQFLAMNIESAELTKYAANVMLATRISFMNQLAQLADKVGADINQIKQGMAKDPRIGPSFLNAGIGYGGSCFPKDVKALIHTGNEHHFPMTLAQEVDNINYFQRTWFINRISTYYGPSLTHKTIGIWGLAFKPETDDIRSAPSIDLIEDLLCKGCKIIAYDPVAQKNIAARYPNNITYATHAHETLHADALVILTEWKEFLRFQPHEFLQLRDKLVFDGRNCFDPIAMNTIGISYFCIGRNSLQAEQPKQQAIHITKKQQECSC